ncbi:hypothetical protein C0J45_16019 [Silurus meridionalis]|nr:hypothetical protein C0J45_16019 [Silurus meridionalis]
MRKLGRPSGKGVRAGTLEVFKLFYHGVDGKRNGVGVILKEEYSKSVVEMNRVSDRVMYVKLELEGLMINVISAYALQVGCEMEEKERFWSELNEVVDGVPRKERLVIETDFNAHVGEGNRGDEEVMGRYGFKERYVEGQMVVDFAKRMEMAVMNTYFKKKDDHKVTYESGGRCTQVDYVLCRRCNLKEIGDCKMLAGDSVARQHHMVVCRMVLKVKKKRRRVRTKRKIRCWKLKEEGCSVRFREEVRQGLGGGEEVLDDCGTTARVMRKTARKVLGVTSENRKENKETWWWNEEVQGSIRRKRLEKQKWDRQSDEKSRQEYKEMRRERGRAGKDLLQVRAIKDGNGNVLTSEESVLRRWREYFEWRRSVLVPIFKYKGDVQTCSNYRGSTLISHTMKLWERVVEAREEVTICEQQYGFMPRKSTTDALFALRMLMKKYREGQKELHCVFADIEKAFDRVPREELWYCMRKSGVSEKYVRVVQDMYDLDCGIFTLVLCCFRMNMHDLYTPMNPSKVSWEVVDEREGSGVVRLQGEEVEKVEFRYLGSTVQSNGECVREVKKRVQAGWTGWRRVIGVICDRRVPVRVKMKVYRIVVRPAMLYGLETVALSKRQEVELEVAELKMLRFSLGVTTMDRIRNLFIRGTAHVGRFGDKVREARLRWFGHVQRRDMTYIGRRMFRIEPPGRRKRGRPRMRFMDVVRKDMQEVTALPLPG